MLVSCLLTIIDTYLVSQRSVPNGPQFSHAPAGNLPQRHGVTDASPAYAMQQGHQMPHQPYLYGNQANTPGVHGYQFHQQKSHGYRSYQPQYTPTQASHPYCQPEHTWAEHLPTT